jgi:hypothetical protein
MDEAPRGFSGPNEIWGKALNGASASKRRRLACKDIGKHQSTTVNTSLLLVL